MGLHLSSTPLRFAEALRGELGGRGYVIRDPASGRFEASSPRLSPLADFLTADDRDTAAHEAIFLETGRGTGALLAAVIHSTTRGQAQGGLRHWTYDDVEALLRDGLRLSRAMTRKNALARIWWGGGKGLIAPPRPSLAADPAFRRSLYREYGAFVSSLRGCYVTAEDVGTAPADVAQVARETRFVTCIPPERGGSGNPSSMTASGVVAAMVAALDALGMGGLAGRSVVLQGTGQVGTALVQLLAEAGTGHILASEVSAEQRDALLDTCSDAPLEVRMVEPGDASILAEPCDVLAPCALGGVLGPKTIPEVRARIVCGAANNPLEDDARDAAALARRGIIYVPDFVANRMGIVSCANEQYGSIPADPDVLRHLDPDWEGGIAQTTRRILADAQRNDETPLTAALRLADELAAQPHPVWSNRGRHLIDSLRRDWTLT